MTLTQGTRLGPYEISAPLGAGGMGEVYRAKDTRLDRSVAIKVLPAQLSGDAELRARFEREARVVSALNHPSICTLHDIGHEQGIDYLVMELLEGESLADRLARGALPLDQALRVAVQIADALDRAHRAGVVHRDLKPGNVMLTKAGAKLLDFGLAKAGIGSSPHALSTLATEARPLTERGAVLGTVQYMSPEQLEGRDADARSDVFAFGALLYEMVTGKKAFGGGSQASVISAILRDAPTPISQLVPVAPAALDRVVTTCLAKDPDDRWQSAHDLANELRWISDGRSSPSASIAPASPPARARASSRAALLAACLVSLVAGAVLARVLVRPAPPAARPETRFVVPPAESGGTIDDGPVLSPDGRSFAYTLGSSDGTSALYHHSLDRGSAKRVPGSEGALDPFFSPDGKSLAFIARGQLRRIDLGTGASQVVCAAADSRGAVWLGDGRILFSPNSSAPLFVVGAAGGEAKPLTKLLDGEQSHRFPARLPDGRHILYSVHGNSDLRGIYWADIVSGERKRLVNDLARAAYDESRGVLLFARQGTLIAQRFDPARGVLSGEAVTIADHVGADDQKSAKDWMSAAGGTVVWRTGTVTERQIVWYDRAGRELAPVTSPGMFQEPILSPDGSLVVVARPDESGVTGLWGYQTGAKDRATRLTFGSESAESALITPDGNGLVYTRGGMGKSSIVRRSLNGTGSVETLFDSPYRVWADDCSPDGRFLICEGGSAANFDLLLLPLEGERKLTPFASSPANETHAAFSPDGKLVAYSSDESGQANVYVQPFPATGTKWQVSTEGADLPRWSADGAELYYVSATRKLTAVAVKSRMPFVAGDATPLFTTRIPALTATGNHTFFLPSRDGKRFLVMSNVGGGTDAAFRVAIDVALPFAK